MLEEDARTDRCEGEVTKLDRGEKVALDADDTVRICLLLLSEDALLLSLG